MTEDPVKLSILIPVKNEGVNLHMMIRILKATIEIPNELIIIFDDLEDDSIPVISEAQKKFRRIIGVHNKLGSGVTNAILSGVKKSSADIVFVIAADDIGPVLTVSKMYKLIEEGSDIVSATRYSGGGKVMGGALSGRVLSNLGNTLFSQITGINLTDCTVGLKMYRRSLFKEIQLETSVGWSHSFEMVIKSYIAGKKLSEVPIISINRFYGGKSSFKLGPWIWEYTRLFLWGLNSLRNERKNLKNEVA